MTMIKYLLCLFLLGASTFGISQSQFSKLDTLRGSVTPDRAWWDLSYYHMDINVDPEEQFISGKVEIQYRVLSDSKSMQIDLQEPMEILKVVQSGEELSYSRFGPVFTIQLKENQELGQVKKVIIYYQGKPISAKNAPWDGGFSWEKDENGEHFIATSCQGLGASVWWPCKDHMYDEVDSMLMSIEIPEDLIDVSNGRLRKIEHNVENKTKKYHWFVDNPINNYGVNVNIGDYAHWQEKYEGESGELDLDYWVLSYNLEKAKEHFVQGRKTIAAFEYWFGPYPFYEDGYKLVEVPYLGMEHQSSVTYGNGFENGYRGTDLTNTGWGLTFDYIIVHETGHEWFANNITVKDQADIWIHEGFATYSEILYLDYQFGKKAGEKYALGIRKRIRNRKPIIGLYEVNIDMNGDAYSKGATLLVMLRELIQDDEKWRQILHGINSEFYHQTVTSKQIEKYISQAAGIDFSSFFDQYLRDIRIPKLEYYFVKKKLYYRWANCIDGLHFPISVEIGKNSIQITPTSEWQSIKGFKGEVGVSPLYYFDLQNVMMD